MQTTLEELQAEHSQLEGLYAQLQADFADARQVSETQRQAAESARTEIAKLQLRLEGVPPLESEVARLREVLEAERSARVASDQIAAVANAKLEQSQASVEDLKARLARAETDAREANQDAGKLRGQVSSLQGSLDSTSKELSQTKEDARRAEATAAELKGQIAVLLTAQASSK